MGDMTKIRPRRQGVGGGRCQLLAGPFLQFSDWGWVLLWTLGTRGS